MIEFVKYTDQRFSLARNISSQAKLATYFSPCGNALSKGKKRALGALSLCETTHFLNCIDFVVL